MYKNIIIIITLSFFVFTCNKKPTKPEDTQPPKVSILYPADQAEIIAGTVITIKTDISDDEGIKEVLFYIDGSVAVTLYKEPFEYKWETKNLTGSHTIKVKAIDKNENVGESNLITVKIIEPVINLFAGYVFNSLHHPIKGAIVTVDTINEQTKIFQASENDNPKSKINFSYKFFGAILKENSFKPEEPKIDESIRKFSNIKILSMPNSSLDVRDLKGWRVETDNNGYFEIKDIKEGTYNIQIEAENYQRFSSKFTQVKGSIQKDFILISDTLPYVHFINLIDGNYSITVEWKYKNFPTLKGFNIYEQHYLKYKNDYEEDKYYYHPHYSDWKKVNSQPVTDKSFTFSSEEYNGRYGVFILPVNIDNVETNFTDETPRKYVGLPINSLPIITFRLTPATKKVYIPEGTHEIALHMRYYYTYKSDIISIKDWKVQISEDSIFWKTVGEHGIVGGPFIRADHYGYTKTFSLNGYKGKSVYFRTQPSSYSGRGIIENKVIDYNQDGTPFYINHKPEAKFTVEPDSGTTDTEFNFDASASSDNEDSFSQLRFSWDWEDDGSWDMENSSNYSPTHKYSIAGTYTVRLRVTDSNGAYDETTKTVSVGYGQPKSIDMVFVQGGTFTMGNTWGHGYSDELPTHTVTVNSFYMGKYEVTNAQVADVFNWALGHGKISVNGSTVQNLEGNSQKLLYLSKISYNGSRLVVKYNYDNYPVIKISWYGAAAFCNYLSECEGLIPVYDLSTWTADWNANGYRLPTEAEWEYAAKGGANGNYTKYAGSDDVDAVAWYSGNSGNHTHEVGTKQPNELGLYDMSGNVWEWCWDWYASDYYSHSPQDNPRGPSSGMYRVLRGGSWYNLAGGVRVALRNVSNPYGTNVHYGFRILRAQ